MFNFANDIRSVYTPAAQVIFVFRKHFALGRRQSSLKSVVSRSVCLVSPVHLLI